MFRRFLGLDRHAKPDPRLPVGDEAAPVARLGRRDRDGPPDRRPPRRAAARRSALSSPASPTS